MMNGALQGVEDLPADHGLEWKVDVFVDDNPGRQPSVDEIVRQVFIA